MSRAELDLPAPPPAAAVVEVDFVEAEVEPFLLFLIVVGSLSTSI